MKTIRFITLIALIASITVAQSRKFEVHKRGMLHQTIYNTGELGRPFDNGGTGIPGGTPPSMEWPPDAATVIDRVEYQGQHNSIGAGLHIAATRANTRIFAFCGAISNSNGTSVQVENVYSDPGTIERVENYPLLADGSINPSFNPNEAEEIITSKWMATGSAPGLGIEVTRISRAWSYPGYNNFIIYEYQLKNTTTDTLQDVFVSWTYGLAPSQFGYTRGSSWVEKNVRNRAFARLDTKRYLSYIHDQDGKPDSLAALFDLWSQPGNRGGLNSPQAVGIMMLHYDYDHLVNRYKTKVAVTDDHAKIVWDANDKMKQPYLLRYENSNIYDSKLSTWIDLSPRKTGPASKSDSANYGSYWVGRVRPNFKNGYNQPVVRGYGFGPYVIAPGETVTYSMAEVIGYGPGVASDSIYMDLGGSSDPSESGPGMHPVPSWYNKLSYSTLTGTIGNDYLKTHPLPWYVDSQAISIRDNADRAIQMYTGTPLLKHDGPVNDLSTQYEPLTAPSHGIYGTPLVKIPFPAPVITVLNTPIGKNKITWNNKLEAFTTPRLNAPLSYYLVYRSLDPLGPWALMDTVKKEDFRYFSNSTYAISDTKSDIGVYVSYYVISVDSLGGKSGITNIVTHNTQRGAAEVLDKVYVVPNPVLVTNGLTGSEKAGDITDKIGFFGLTKKCTIKIFSFSGQLVQTIEHDADEFSNISWYQISRNHQLIASGVYFFTVQDAATGKRVKGKFVIIH